MAPPTHPWAMVLMNQVLPLHFMRLSLADRQPRHPLYIASATSGDAIA